MDYVFTVKPGERVQLSDCDPSFTADLKHQDGKELIPQLGDRLTNLQETHYASGAGGILIVLQGLDTAGKDGTIRHVLTYFNPAGCEMHSFKVPTPEEAAHDFLWRAHRVTPAQSVIGIFNRSYYEDVLVTRVHQLVPRSVWERRYRHINDFEALLVDSGTVILKFFLYISKEEQRERLLAREQDRDKAWKLSTTDWREHDLYDRYVQAYEDALNRCSAAEAPWYIVPANHKWFRNVAVAQTIIDRLEPLAAGWRKDLEARGQEQLAAIARLHEHQG